MKLGMGPRRSSRVCIFTAALVVPREYRQTQVDGCRVQSIDGVGQFQPQAFVGVKPARLSSQSLGEIGVDTPIAAFVGIGQCRTSDWSAKPHMVKLSGLGQQTCFDIAQAFAVGQLRESHDPMVFGTMQRTYFVIAIVTVDDAGKGSPRKEVHEFSK